MSYSRVHEFVDHLMSLNTCFFLSQKMFMAPEASWLRHVDDDVKMAPL